MTRRIRLLSLALAVAGAAIFAAVIVRIGTRTILENARLLGFGFVILIVLGGARQVLRAIAWRRSLDAQSNAPSFFTLLRLRLIGEAFSDLAPAGPLLGASMKVWAGSKEMSFETSASSVLIENVMFGLAVGPFILSGITFALIEFARPEHLPGLLGIPLVGLAAVVWLVRSVVKPNSSWSGRLSSFVRNRGWLRGFIGRYGPKFLALEKTMRGFFATRGTVFFGMLGIEFALNLIGVLDAYVILQATTGHCSLASAYMIESVGRGLQLGLALVPGQFGMMEGAAGVLFRALHYAASEGVSLVLFRKIRDVFWAGVGLLLAPQVAANLYAERGSAE
jgi:Lysylphosphatidylglycerol synthase TM region